MVCSLGVSNRDTHSPSSFRQAGAGEAAPRMPQRTMRTPAAPMSSSGVSPDRSGSSRPLAPGSGARDREVAEALPPGTSSPSVSTSVGCEGCPIATSRRRSFARPFATPPACALAPVGWKRSRAGMTPALASGRQVGSIAVTGIVGVADSRWSGGARVDQRRQRVSRAFSMASLRSKGACGLSPARLLLP